jgi:uncharacterized protein (TIGR02145 family)
MNSIVSPPEGLVIYNTSTKSLCWFDGATWKSGGDGLSCGYLLYGGKLYPTVQIGSQCWMAKNLNIGTRIDGNIEQSDNDILEKYCYNNIEDSCDEYGGYYLWNEMMQYDTTEGVRGICPPDWHLPSDSELTILVTYLGGESIAGEKLKETGTLHWNSPNVANNLTNFSFPGGGNRTHNGFFANIRIIASLWSSTKSNSTEAWYRYLGNGFGTIDRGKLYYLYGISVRCIKD